MRWIILIISVILFSNTCGARTAAFTDSTARSLISEVVGKTFLLQYEQALKTVDELEKVLGEHPVLPALRAGVLYCRMLDHEDLLDMNEFEKQYDLAWKQSEGLKKSGEVAEADLFCGVLLGFKALNHQRLNEWWPAVRYGIKAVGYLNDCLKLDSSYVDAFLGVGSFKYWRSRATDFINWLPFIPDEKKEGIELVRRAMNEGLLGREISRSTLAWILIDDNQPYEAIILSIEGLKGYPGSRFYLWTLADGYRKSGKWLYAEQVYQQLYDSIHRLKRNNHYNEIGICRNMAYINRRLNKPKIALTWVEGALSYPLDEMVKKRRKKDLEELKKIRSDLQKQISASESRQ